MANEEQLRILREGVLQWNHWRKENSELPDLRNANFPHADLRDADFCDVDFRGATLSHSNLQGAAFIGANVFAVDFSGANLRDTDFSLANLTGSILSFANLTGADLDLTNLSSVALRDTAFHDANLAHTHFADCDLSQAQGLDLVNHRAPSSIGIDTIYRSKGKIPSSFLRGCGVPESFITHMHSLVAAVEGIQFYSCFISYSSKDEDFARRMHGRMRDAQLRVWFAPEDIQGGKKLIEQIETAIRVYDKLLVVLSEASLESDWVMTELRKGFRAQKQSGKRKLFPVRLVDFERLRDWECFDADSGKDLAVELREYFIPDFSNWKDHDSFEAGFDRLLKDLRAESPAP